MKIAWYVRGDSFRVKSRRCGFAPFIAMDFIAVVGSLCRSGGFGTSGVFLSASGEELGFWEASDECDGE